jgi:hypothetical protein
MNQKGFELLDKFVPKTYLQQANEAYGAQENEIRLLIEKVFRKFFLIDKT